MKKILLPNKEVGREEFAIKLPGNDDGVFIYLDAKFPGETYTRADRSYEEGNPEKLIKRGSS